MKNIFDCHVHSYFSEDSDLSMAEAILKALEKGLEGLAFTDHIDINYPYEDNYPSLDYEQYSKQLRQLQRKVYPKLKLLIGVEAGLQHDNLKENNAFIKENDFDFVIGSVHSVDGIALAEDDFFRDKTVKEAFTQFLEYTHEMITKFDNFDVLGHMDNIRRYTGGKDNSFPAKEYLDPVDNILRTLIDKGKGIEINTSGLRYGLDSFHPVYWVLKRYRELGGEIITLGSDAHRVEDIGAYFEKGVEAIQRAGFKYLTYFKKRQPEFVPISKVV